MEWVQHIQLIWIVFLFAKIQAISISSQVVRLAPNLPDPYDTLGRIYDDLGNDKKAVDFYMIAAHLNPKDSSMWKRLFTRSL